MSKFLTFAVVTFAFLAVAAITVPSFAFQLSLPGVSVGSQTCVKTPLGGACL